MSVHLSQSRRYSRRNILVSELNRGHHFTHVRLENLECIRRFEVDLGGLGGEISDEEGLCLKNGSWPTPRKRVKKYGVKKYGINDTTVNSFGLTPSFANQR